MRIDRVSKWIAAGALAAVMLAAPLPGEAQRRAAAQLGPQCVGGLGALFDAIEPVPLSAAEEEALLFLREEEKLARDVYLGLAERWQLPIFANIAQSEQKHMDLVLLVLDVYGIADPVVDDTVGAFSDATLANLYLELSSRGDQSLVDALTVGATIEDMDVADLLELLEATANDHVELLAQNLAKGSRNHLRAFVRALAAQGVTYVPQYLDKEIFEAILAADWERGGFVDADGNFVPACGATVGGFGMRRGPGFGGPAAGGNGGNGGNGDGGTGNGDCDGTGPHGGQGDDGNGGNGGNGDGGTGNGDCDGTGPHGGQGDGGNGHGGN
jgi:hypothetical protein